MEELTQKWLAIQSDSLECLEASHRRGELMDYVSKFEECLDAMYALMDRNEPKKPSDEQADNLRTSVESFEKELQLKHHLAALLATESPVASQAEMNVSIWRMQPYVYSLVQDSANR